MTAINHLPINPIISIIKYDWSILSCSQHLPFPFPHYSIMALQPLRLFLNINKQIFS